MTIFSSTIFNNSKGSIGNISIKKQYKKNVATVKSTNIKSQLNNNCIVSALKFGEDAQVAQCLRSLIYPKKELNKFNQLKLGPLTKEIYKTPLQLPAPFYLQDWQNTYFKVGKDTKPFLLRYNGDIGTGFDIEVNVPHDDLGNHLRGFYIAVLIYQMLSDKLYTFPLYSNFVESENNVHLFSKPQFNLYPFQLSYLKYFYYGYSQSLNKYYLSYLASDSI
jgi:hypothetical protein